MGEPYFVWKGIDSREKSIWVQEYPALIRPAMRYKDITIPGKPGALTLLEGDDVYDPYVREIKIMPKPGADLHDIRKWLVGSGTVIFGNEGDKKQAARIYDEAEFQREFCEQHSCVVRFLCDPFKSSIYDETSISVDMSGTSFTVRNPGDVVAYPLVSCTATGDFAITIAGTRTVITGATGTVTIDCEAGSVSAAGTFRTYGDFGKLKPGNNTIKWEQGVSAITITPRWRYL